MQIHGSGGRPDVAALERRFTELTLLMYDTRVPLDVLEARVLPVMARDVEFVDPWVHTRGLPIFAAGLRGFHCVIRFDFTIFQLHVQLDPQGRGGRVLVDGVMHLRQLVVYTYPLRTQLVYQFEWSEGGEGFLVTRQEEMWSLGDLLANLPAIGRLYELGRRGWGRFFGAMFAASCAVVTRLRPQIAGAGSPSWGSG